MHHAQVDVGGRIGIRLFEYAKEIIPYLTYLEELFYWIFLRHDESIYMETNRLQDKFYFESIIW